MRLRSYIAQLVRCNSVGALSNGRWLPFQRPATGSGPQAAVTDVEMYASRHLPTKVMGFDRSESTVPRRIVRFRVSEEQCAIGERSTDTTTTRAPKSLYDRFGHLLYMSRRDHKQGRRCATAISAAKRSIDPSAGAGL
jgi:hypothetical protein